MILVLCVIAILCSNNPGAVPELQTYGLTSYQTVITIVKHIMEKLRYKDSATAGGWWTLVTLLASRVYWSVIVCTHITEPMELTLACVLGLFHILKEVKCLKNAGVKVLWLHKRHFLCSNMIKYIIFSNRNGSVITTCSVFKLQWAACPLSQSHIFIRHLFNIYFNIILLFMSLYPKLSLTFELSDAIFISLCIFHQSPTTSVMYKSIHCPQHSIFTLRLVYAMLPSSTLSLLLSCSWFTYDAKPLYLTQSFCAIVAE
jgi:hypothetical protein